METPPLPVPPQLEQLPAQMPTPPSPHPFQSGLTRKRRGKGLIFGLGAVLAIAGLAYYFYFSSRGGILILDTSPGLTVLVNNHPPTIKKNERGLFIRAFPGKYRLQISKKDYLPFTEDVSLSRGETALVRPIYAFLPKSLEAATGGIDYVRPSLDQKALFYLSNNRHTIYRMDIANQVPIPLTDQPLNGVTDVQWSNTPDIALISQSNGVFLREIPKFDFQHQSLLRLGGKEIISPIWDPTNPEQMAFAYFPSTGEKSLVFSDKRLVQLDRKADLSSFSPPKLVWSPNSQYIILIAASQDSSGKDLWVYTTKNGSLKKITNTKDVVDASFAPDSKTILYEKGGSTSHLAHIQVDGSDGKDLAITGQVARSAWRDNSSFYLPENDRNLLSLFNLNGKKESTVFSFANQPNIQGMFYFAKPKSLIFYTDSTIYTVNLTTQ